MAAISIIDLVFIVASILNSTANILSALLGVGAYFIWTIHKIRGLGSDFEPVVQA